MSLSRQSCDGSVRQPNPFGALDDRLLLAGRELGTAVHDPHRVVEVEHVHTGNRAVGVDQLGVEPGDVPGHLREQVRLVQPDDVLPGLHGHRAVAVAQMANARVVHMRNRARACWRSAGRERHSRRATRTTAPRPRTVPRPPSSEFQERGRPWMAKGRRPNRRPDLSPYCASMRHRAWSAPYHPIPAARSRAGRTERSAVTWYRRGGSPRGGRWVRVRASLLDAQTRVVRRRPLAFQGRECRKGQEASSYQQPKEEA